MHAEPALGDLSSELARRTLSTGDRRRHARIRQDIANNEHCHSPGKFVWTARHVRQSARSGKEVVHAAREAAAKEYRAVAFLIKCF